MTTIVLWVEMKQHINTQVVYVYCVYMYGLRSVNIKLKIEQVLLSFISFFYFLFIFVVVFLLFIVFAYFFISFAAFVWMIYKNIHGIYLYI